MKISSRIFLAFVLFSNCVYSQNGIVHNYFSIKPQNIKIRSSGIQEYDVILKWQNLDAFDGRVFNCNAVKGVYVTGLNNDSVTWRSVTLAKIANFRQKNFEGKPIPSFDNFKYKISSTNFLKEDFYSCISAENRDLAKWLVSDAIQMEGLVKYVFDSLEYGKEYIPKYLENYDIKFENWVTFQSRYQKFKWIGIAANNGVICAIVKFESLYNPLKINNRDLDVKGRSLFCGEIWISFVDKKVEYAFMVEDVIMKLNGPLFPKDQLIDLQREVVFNKKRH